MVMILRNEAKKTEYHQPRPDDGDAVGDIGNP
jgi:hypothetical protein